MLIIRLIALFLCVIYTERISAQYTFAHHHGSNAEDEYKYILELNNGNFLACGWGGCNIPLVYTTSLTLFDPKGNILKEWACNERDQYRMDYNGIIEGESGEYFVGGSFLGTTPNGNPYLIKLLSDGTILKDTFYGIASGGGDIHQLCYRSADKSLFTVGLGNINGKNCLVMQKLDKDLKRIWIKYLSEYGSDVSKRFFIDSIHNELILFTRNLLMYRIDPHTGNVLSNINLYDVRYCTNEADFPISSYILDYFQLNDSVFSFCYNSDQYGNYHFLNVDRFGSSLSTKVLNKDSFSHFNDVRMIAFHARKKGGFVIHTYEDTLAFFNGFDADLNLIWRTEWKLEIGASLNYIEESRSGGTYGCGSYWNTYDSTKEEYFIFNADSNCRFNTVITKDTTVTKRTFGNLYPNPCDDFAIIDTEFNDFELRLYSLSGKLILDQDVNRIDTRELVNGIYSVELQDGNTLLKQFYKLFVIHK